MIQMHSSRSRPDIIIRVDIILRRVRAQNRKKKYVIYLVHLVIEVLRVLRVDFQKHGSASWVLVPIKIII